MKTTTLKILTVMLMTSISGPAHLAAQEQTESEVSKQEPHRYKLFDLGTFGGPQSDVSGLAQVLSKGGTVAGGADTPLSDPNYPNFNPLLGQDRFIQHSFLWKNGELLDLGALPGVTSSSAIWVNADGEAAGLSEDGVIDSLTGMPEVKAILWSDHRMINLGTLGGNESAAVAVNKRDQVVGFSANSTPDPYSMFGWGTEARAFLWQNGAMQDLGTLGGPDSAAVYINEGGQIAGQAYTNSIANAVTGVPTLDPFLWEDGRMIDLGTLGGTIGSPNGLNDSGEVVGQSNLAGDLTFHPFSWTKSQGMQDLGTFGGDFGTANWVNDSGDVVGWAFTPGNQSYHAFLRKKGGRMRDLGTLEGYMCSAAFSINSRRQVVGSLDLCSGIDVRAFLWENGNMIDLNIFVPPGSDLTLKEPTMINERGEIVGKAVRSNGDIHVFLLIPCDKRNNESESCEKDKRGTYSFGQENGASIDRALTKPDQPTVTPSKMNDRVPALLTNRVRKFGLVPPK